MPKSLKAESLVEDLAETLSPGDGITFTLDVPQPWAATGVYSPAWSPGTGRAVRPVRIRFHVPDEAQVGAGPRNPRP